MFFVKQADKDIFDDIYCDMKRQFPLQELKNRESFDKLLSDGKYCLYCAFDGECRVGYFLVFKDSMSLWLDYIAIFKEHHSKGYGHKIFDLMKQFFAEDFNGIYLEVEKPDEREPNTLRRIKFYESLGAKKLDIDYFYPNKDGYIPMDLYFMPFKTGLSMPDKTAVKSTIKTAFSALHGDIPHVREVFEKIK